MVNRKRFLLISLFLLGASFVAAQENVGTYQVRVSLDKPDWVYDLNQTAKFSVAVTLNNTQIAGIPLKYSCGPEVMPPMLERSVTTTAQPLTIDGATMKEPGFYRCIAMAEKDGRTYRGLATAGFRPDLIKPVVTEPSDLDKFWNDGKARLANIPIEPRMEHLPTSSTSKVDV